MSVAAPGHFRHGWIFAAVWLFFLNENLSTLLARPDDWQRALGLAALAVFTVGYLFAVAMLRHRGRHSVARAWAVLLGLLVLFALQVPGAGYHALTCVVYIAAAGM